MGDVIRLLEALRSPDSCEDAWVEFLQSYSPLLYQAARMCTSNDDDAASDCYVHICERLARNSFRKLLKFKPHGNASFTTWLHVVARNLCFDWHRTQNGRSRPFKSVEALSPLDIEVYNARFVQGIPQHEAIHDIQSRFPAAGLTEITEIEERLQNVLTSRQQWMLSARRRTESKARTVLVEDDEEPGMEDIADPGPNPEMQIADQEVQTRLRKSLASIPARERVLLQLRFEQGLSLEEVARLCGFHDAQRAHRSLGAILSKLRQKMK